VLCRAELCYAVLCFAVLRFAVRCYAVLSGWGQWFLVLSITRHCGGILPCVAYATEDAERPLRYFRKGDRILRYRMYVGEDSMLRKELRIAKPVWVVGSK